MSHDETTLEQAHAAFVKAWEAKGKDGHLSPGERSKAGIEAAAKVFYEGGEEWCVTIPGMDVGGPNVGLVEDSEAAAREFAAHPDKRPNKYGHTLPTGHIWKRSVGPWVLVTDEQA